VDCHVKLIEPLIYYNNNLHKIQHMTKRQLTEAKPAAEVVDPVVEEADEDP
jgi:hypothetical protein